MNPDSLGYTGLSVQIYTIKSGTSSVLLYLFQLRFADFTDKQKKTILQKCLSHIVTLQI